MKKTVSTLPIGVAKNREDYEKRLRKRFSDLNFRESLDRLKREIASGNSMSIARINMGIESDAIWNDLKYAIGSSMLSPETVMLEWQIRNSHRYSQALDLYLKSEAINDLDMMARAIMMLQKIDSDDLELKKYLGLLRPPGDGQGEEISGITTDEVMDAERRFAEQVKERILRKLEIRAEAQPPIPIDVLTESETKRDADQLGQTTVAQDSSGGQVK